MSKSIFLNEPQMSQVFALLEEARESLAMYLDPEDENCAVAPEHRQASEIYISRNVEAPVLHLIEYLQTRIKIELPPIKMQKIRNAPAWQANMPDGLWTLTGRTPDPEDPGIPAGPLGGTLHLYESGGSYVKSFNSPNAAKAWLEQYRAANHAGAKSE